MTASSAGEAAALARAEVLCELRRFDEAVTLLGQVMAARPQEWSAWCLMARAQLGRDEVPNALQAARTAASLEPESEWPRRLASIALTRLGEHEAAMREARSAVRLAPHAWQTLVQLAEAGSRSKHTHDEARQAAERAIALAPNEAGPHVAAGVVAAARGSRKEAALAFRRSLAIDPQNSAAHNELARLQLRNRAPASAGRLAAAAAGFSTAVGTDPRAHASRRNLDLVIQMFLGRSAYLLLLDAYLVGRGTAALNNPLGRMVPVLLLGLPGLFIWRFIHRLPPGLRRHVFGLLRDRRFGPAVGLDVFAVVCLLAGAIATQTIRPGLAGAACVAAVLARVLLLVQEERSALAGSGKPERPMVSTGLLWAVSVTFLLSGVALLVAAASSDASALGPLPGLACVGAFLASLHAIRRRRRTT